VPRLRSAASLACVTLLLVAACDGGTKRARGGSSGGGGARTDAGSGAGADAGTGGGSDGGPRDTGVAVATDCLEDTACVDTTDCPNGSRCNLRLSPPRCQQLFCGGEGTLCSEDGLCSSGLGCLNDVCRPCTPCGERCVDTQTDRSHCGRCFNSIRPDEQCVDGMRVCAEGRMMCGADGVCVDVQTSLSSCGRCDNACPTSGGLPGFCASGRCGSFALVEETGFGACAEVCAGRGAECQVLDPFPGVAEGPAAGVASYGEGDILLPLPDCTTRPVDQAEDFPLTRQICACRPLP
jgi:hypothetical protein